MNPFSPNRILPSLAVLGAATAGLLAAGRAGKDESAPERNPHEVAHNLLIQSGMKGPTRVHLFGKKRPAIYGHVYHGTGWKLAKCLEFGISAEGKTLADARANLEAAVIEAYAKKVADDERAAQTAKAL